MTQAEMLVAHVRRTLRGLTACVPDTISQYSCLPLCLIDAVFSLGVKYESTQRTVLEFRTRYGWEQKRAQSATEHTVSDLLEILRPYVNRWEEMARVVFRNRQRTSAKSGILKAEAVFHAASVLKRFGVETLADALKAAQRSDLPFAFRSIKGQGSGLSWNYLRILFGDTDAVKADRMVRRYVAEAVGSRVVSQETCEQLVPQACAILKSQFPNLTPSLLEHAIWEYQRNRTPNRAKQCRAMAAASRSTHAVAT